MRTQRMPPWDLNGDLWDKLNQIKIREQRPWRWMLTKGVELFIEWYESKNGVVRLPGADVLPVVALPAPVLPAAALPASVSVAVVPAVSVPQTEAWKKVEWLRERMARAEMDIMEAKARLLIEPGHIPSQTVMRVLPARLVEDQGWLVEAQEALAAELSSKQIDNGENEVED